MVPIICLENKSIFTPLMIADFIAHTRYSRDVRPTKGPGLDE